MYFKESTMGKKHQSSSKIPVEQEAAALFDEEQEAAIKDFLFDNAKARFTWRRTMTFVDVVVAVGLVYVAIAHSHAPGGASDLLAPIKGLTSPVDIQMALGLSGLVAVVNAAVTWFGARGAMPLAALLSAIPLLQMGTVWVQASLWKHWQLAWLPLGAPFLTWISWYCERMFDNIDAEIAKLVTMQFDKKTA